MPLIQISVNQDQIAIDPLRIEKAAEAILNALGCTEAELSIVVVDDEEMVRLNRQYRHHNSTTDVLAFPMAEGEFGDVCPELLGDVVLSAPTAHRMSHLLGCPLPAVLDLLLAHGILHLIGHGHEEGEEKARLMEEKTLEILKSLGHSENLYYQYVGKEL